MGLSTREARRLKPIAAQSLHESILLLGSKAFAIYNATNDILIERKATRKTPKWHPITFLNLLRYVKNPVYGPQSYLIRIKELL